MINFEDKTIKIHQESLDLATKLLEEIKNSLFPEPEVKPDPPDGVLFLWTHGNKNDGRWVDLDIITDGPVDCSKLTLMQLENNQLTYARICEVTANIELVKEIISWHTSKREWSYS